MAYIEEEKERERERYLIDSAGNMAKSDKSRVGFRGCISRLIDKALRTMNCL